MSKIITSPVDRWPGTVTLSDPLNYVQAIGYEDAYLAVTAMQLKAVEDKKTLTIRKINAALMPGVLSCVEEFNLDNHDDWTVEGFPATPGDDAAALFNWIFDEVILIANGKGEDEKKE